MAATEVRVGLDAFAGRFLELDGAPYDVALRPYTRVVYNCIANPDVREFCLKFGRQTGKCVYPRTLISSDIGLPFPIHSILGSGARVSSVDPASGRLFSTKNYRFHHMGLGTMYTVRTETGREITCSPSHLLWCKETSDRDAMWVPAMMSRGCRVLAPKRAWKFLRHSHEVYNVPIGDMFGLNEAMSMETAERIGMGRSVTFDSDHRARAYHLFLDKLGVPARRDGATIIAGHPNDDALPEWELIVSVERFGYAEYMDIEMLDGPPVYTAEGMVTHNTTSVASALLGYSALVPMMRTLYINPEDQLTKYFSQERLAPMMSSPKFHLLYTLPDREQAVYRKRFKNQSKIFLRSAFHHAERVRGMTMDTLTMDETQHYSREVMNIAEATLNVSKRPKQIFMGTPNTFESLLETKWDRSTKSEWTIVCGSCSRRNILDERNMDPHGLICRFCGKFLDRSKGEWAVVDRQSNIPGYRFPTIAAEWKDWDDLWDIYENAPMAQFYNEYLALPHDEGLAAIAFGDVAGCCDPSFTPMWQRPPDRYKNSQFTLGVDWGKGGGSTALAVMMNEGARKRVVFGKTFRGTESDPEFIFEDILRYFNAFRAHAIGVDFGGEMGMNSRLRDRLGRDRVMEFFYSGVRVPAEVDRQSGRVNLNRELALTMLFREMRERAIIMPSWELPEFQRLGKHFLNMIREYSESRRIEHFIRKVGERDDFVHASCYARTALRILNYEINLPEIKE